MPSQRGENKGKRWWRRGCVRPGQPLRLTVETLSPSMCLELSLSAAQYLGSGTALSLTDLVLDLGAWGALGMSTVTPVGVTRDREDH